MRRGRTEGRASQRREEEQHHRKAPLPPRILKGPKKGMEGGRREGRIRCLHLWKPTQGSLSQSFKDDSTALNRVTKTKSHTRQTGKNEAIPVDKKENVKQTLNQETPENIPPEDAAIPTAIIVCCRARPAIAERPSLAWWFV